MKHVFEYRFRYCSLLTITLVVAALGWFAITTAPAREQGTTAAVYAPGSFSFSAPQQLLRPPIAGDPGFGTLLLDQDQEPEIKIDLFGTIYISAIHGVPGGVDLWKSTDSGATFAYLGEPDGAQDKCGVTGTVPCTAGAGGGDDSIDVSTGGYLYISSLYLGNVTMSTSYDGGIGGALPGQKWEVNPATATVPSDDRQWVAAYGTQTLGMTYNATALTRPPGGIGLFFTKSTDGGKTFGPSVEITAQGALDETNVHGNLVVDPYTGNFFTCYIPNGQNNVIKVASSTDGGMTWTITTAYTGPAGTTNRGVFPILAMDRGGNLHMVFTRSTETTNADAHVFLTSTANPAAAAPTWTSAVQIDNNGANTGTACLAWPIAGSSGTVDITWLGSSGTSPTTAPFDWRVYFAQVTGAVSSNPTITSNAITGQVHNAGICFSGLGCASGTRDMAEYYTVTLDPNGQAHIAFEDSMHGTCASESNCTAMTWYTKQTSGPSAYTPPAGPPLATFAANVNVNGSGNKAEPNAWVDSHNCIFGGAIGGPTAFRSQDGGLTFTPRNVVVGTGSHGGDFDIITVPKADGTRPDQIYTADLGITSVHIGKSSDGGNTYVAPGMNGIGGEVSASSDRMWLWPDRGVPTAADQTIYITDHEFASELIRFAALTNDFAWSAFSSGMTSSEFILPPGNTFPNTNPGPVFVNRATHEVIGVFAAASTTTNAQDPPFGKMPNVWLAVGPAPAAQGLAPGPFVNYPVFKGMIDSPAAAPSPAPSIPPGVATIGNHVGNLFPSAASDSAGNIYAVWMTNNSRLNSTVSNTSTRSTTFDIWFAASHDGGKNFYGPFRVSSGVGTCQQPWIAAGDNGRVDIVFYQTDKVPAVLVADPSTPAELTGGPNAMPAGSTWNVMFAQSLNANSREPVFTVTQASDHIIHTGSISNGGLFGSSDRSLLDFFEVSIGPDGMANIFNADNGTTSLHINYAHQTGGAAAVTNPNPVTCLPGPPLPTAIVSRKTHGAAGDFDIDLKPPAPGIECRTGGPNNDFKIVVTFPLPVTVNGTPKATVTSGTGSVSNVTVSGNQVTIDLTGVTNAQRLTVTLNSVSDANGSGNVPINMAVLNADTTADTFVNSADIAQTKSKSGQVVDSSNFRNDVTIDGNLNSADIAFVKSKSGTALP